MSSFFSTSPSWASAIDLDEKVYSPIIEEGEWSLETRQGVDLGKSTQGEAGGVVELEHGVSSFYSLSLIADWDRDVKASPTLSGLGLESVFHFGRIPGLDADYGGYLEYNHSLKGEGSALEGKFLLQKRIGLFETKLNLIAERNISKPSQYIETSYALSTVYQPVHNFGFGGEIFGTLGTEGHWGGRQIQYAGPVLNYQIQAIPGIGLKMEGAWLWAFQPSLAGNQAQFRFVLELERQF